MKRNTLLPLPLRVISGVTALAQILTGAPIHLCAQDAASASAASLPQGAPTVARMAAQEIAVNRTIPKATAPSQSPHFSSEPTDDEISAARVFEEPLIPTKGQSDKAENLALSLALNAYLQRGSNDEVSAITQFLTAYPTSRWRASILLNLGIVYRWTGYFSKALESWEGAWRLLKNETEPQTKALADRALAELMELNARVGRYERLKPLFQEIQGREIRGSADEKISRAKEGLWMMNNKPGQSFLCGPSALSNVFAATHPGSPTVSAALTKARSSVNGFSLAKLEALAKESGLKYRMAKRTPGATVPIPCVVNWKVGHYAALVKEDHGRYLVEDPTFAYDIWISPAALDAESSGYFLIAAADLPKGWEAVSRDDGRRIWGKGNPGVGDSSHDTPNDKKCKPDCPTQGMAQYNFHALVMSLNIWDSPVGYNPPRGPSMNFKVTYNQREANQPAVFTYSNLGQKWTHDWLSYIKDNPTAPAANILVVVSGGGAEAYTFNTTTQTYNVQRDSNTILTRFTSPSLRYERQYPNGAKDIYGLSDGATTFPRKIFLTQRVDPAGNAITFTYDASYRLVAATDALGQVTTLSYELSGQSGDNLLITKVTDPFGRFAKFDYSASTPRQLIKITDVIGITSEFAYTSDFINAMTTPYGTTKFAMGESGVFRWIEATDPTGAKERAEFNANNDRNNLANSEPVSPTGLTFISNISLKYRNTFYWNKKAVMEAGGDYTKAKIWHWFSTSYEATSSILESEKEPLESRVWYQYPGQTGAGADYGITVAQPSKVARVLDDGKTQLSQYVYTATGLPQTAMQPALDGSGNPIAGRTLSYDYDPVNNVDLKQVRQTTGGSNETVSQFTYNSQHRPLTATDAAGQVATFTYNSSGQVLTETRVRNGANETTTWGYDANGYLLSVTGPLPGASVSFTYDGYGRVRTVTDSVGYALVYDYDNLDRVTKVTFPDGTFQQTIYDRLDPQQQRDRLGRWTYTMYDALRHPAWMYDAAGRTTSYDWCTCGALNAITDGEGHKTSFTRDLQYRLTGKTYADNSSLSYIYESAASRLKSMTDAKAQVTNYQYYVDNNLMQISYTGSNPSTPGVSFTYDPNYNRVASMTDGTGTTSYGYNPITSTPTLGAGRLASVDQPLTNDTVTYGYDEYGRVTNRSINGAANATSTVYDSLGRMTSMSNLLGSFNYAYVSTTPRVDHTNYPNGQITQYIYFGNTGDERLQEIWNKTSTGANISKFDYTYSAVGDIASWTQKAGASTPFVHSFGYDGVDQLLGDSVTLSGATQHQYSYRYDRAGNRTTEQIDSLVSPASYNNLNQLTSRGGNGQMTFEGTLNEPGTVAIAGGSPAPTDGSNHFRLAAPVIIGSNSLPIVATDASGNATSNHIQLTVSGTTAQTLTYDLNGNLVSDSANTYEWDAANRLVAVNESGNRRSEFTYNGLGQRVKIIEKTNGSVTSTKQLVWCPGDAQPCEERDASNNVTKRYYPKGMRIGSTSYFYTRDHLGSVRELTNGSGTVQTRYDYDPYGRRTRLTGTLDADFGFTGHYYHQPSGLHLVLYRAYNADLGRWISRDPIAEQGGINLYGYVANNPIYWRDLLGLTAQGALYGGSIGAFIGGLGGLVLGGLGGTALAPGGGTIGGGYIGEVEGALLGGTVGAWLGDLLTGRGTPPQVLNNQGKQCPTPPPVPDNPADAPGEGWEWRGNGPPGSNEGSWYNPDTGESLHPDFDHGPPGPHWDWTDPQGGQWRIPPGGGAPTPK